MSPLVLWSWLLALGVELAPPSPVVLSPDSSRARADRLAVFVRASDAYEAGQFETARELYASLAKEAPTAEIFYNLGNAALRSGALGDAIVAYRRALAARPRDADARANLAYARQSAKDALAPPEPTPLVRTLFFWHFVLSRSEAWSGLVVANVFFWLFLSLRLRRRDSELLRWGAWGAAAVALLLGGSVAAHGLFPQRVAVARLPEVEARSGIGADTVVRFKLHEGAEVRVLEADERAARIILPDGQQGWLPRAAIEIVGG